MLQLGITGGIGSGKSTVCRVFAQLGVPVYDADTEAKKLMHTPRLVKKLSQKFGSDIYTPEGELNRARLAEIVFNDPEKVSLLNSIVHPEVFDDYHAWVKLQNAPYTIKEAALLYESGSYKELHAIINVYAPLALRIQRLMERSKLSEQQIRDRIKNQLNEKDRTSRADYIIKNDEKTLVISRVLNLHRHFLKLAANESK